MAAIIPPVASKLISNPLKKPISPVYKISPWNLKIAWTNEDESPAPNAMIINGSLRLSLIEADLGEAY